MDHTGVSEEDRIRKEEKAMMEDISIILGSYEKTRRNLIPVLQKIQAKYSYLAPEALKLVGEYLNLSTSEVYGVATFYNQFRFHPPGRHPIRVCLGTACHIKGGDIILENFERKLGIKDGETTDDREFSIERVACVGCCALAPVAVVEEIVHGHMAPSKVDGILLGFEIEKEKQERERNRNGSDAEG
ncbi:MAG: NADH-quinone oxidoreductase subunit NuoE [Deltaproteobacteria bacterium]|nr:NADH-quinone oxidoreductase subunit NuoE [Deltaproteobacteria bacterium]